MCGLVGGMRPIKIGTGMDAIAHRGPDAQGVATIGPYTLGHVRLAIQDLTHASDQPFDRVPFVVTYNGELWNPDAMRELLGGTYSTRGDTEVVAEALSQHGVQALPMLDGMFALAWADHDYLYLARDAYGEVPLHYGWTRDLKFVYASEVATLLALGAVPGSIDWVKPGTWMRVDARKPSITESRWFRHPERADRTDGHMRTLLKDGTLNRWVGEAPIAVLASGGLDSSAILALLVQSNIKPTCYTAVYDPTSQDYQHAKRVTDHLGLELVPVRVPDPDREQIGEAIRATEMPHKAQIEIALGCLALAKAISSDGFKVVVSGEGSDELLGSYGMAYHAIKQHGWFGYRSKEFYNQHRKNFARTNKVFMRHGIEARLPFLHDPLVRYVLSRTEEEVTRNGRHPKALLASAVSDLLPSRTAYRKKAAFQKEAGIDKATARAVADPTRYYKAEHQRMFQGVAT